MLQLMGLKFGKKNQQCNMKKGPKKMIDLGQIAHRPLDLVLIYQLAYLIQWFVLDLGQTQISIYPSSNNFKFFVYISKSMSIFKKKIKNHNYH